MKPRFVKLISALVCIAVIFTVIVFTRTELRGAEPTTLLFYNDRTWTLTDRMPVEQVHSIYYVPITYLAQLPSLTVNTNETFKTFIIIHGDLFLSFDITTDFAMNQDKERMYLKTAEYHGERYVPVRTVCAYLGLNYEEMVNPITGAVALRVTDGNQQSTLGELVERKYPSLFPETSAQSSVGQTTSSPPVTSVPPNTESKPILSDRTVYITVEDCPGEYTSDILDVLDEFGYKATFFVIGSNAVKDIPTLSRIAAMGHQIALHTMTHDASVLTDASAVLSDIKMENELLERLIKQKSHIWRAPEGSAKIPADFDEVSRVLSEHGYVVWDYNIDVPTNVRASRAADSVISSIWKTETAVLRFKENASTAEILRLVLEFIKENSDACEVRAISPAFSDNDF